MNNTVSKLKVILEHWEHSVWDALPNFLLALGVCIIFIVIAGIVRRSMRFILKKPLIKHPYLIRMIATLLYVFFVISGILIALQIVGWEGFITHILAGAGILGIIAGFAFKDMASNIFAGLLLKLQDPFKAGDWVQIDNKYGVVIELGWITTQIKTVPGQEVFVPNQLIYSSTFVNYSTFGKRRVILQTGVSYGDDLEKVRQVSIDEVQHLPFVLQDEVVDFYFSEIGNSTYNFQLRFWIEFHSNDDFQKAMSECIISIKKRFEKENISIAYPVTTLDFGVKGGVNLYDNPIKIDSVK